MKFSRLIRPLLAGSLALGVALAQSVFALAGSAGAEPRDGGGAYTCTGGDVAPGVYHSIVVKGVCYMPAGTVVVRDDLTVAPGALLDAGNAGDPAAHPLIPATVLVWGNVNVGSGSVLFLGCSPNLSCPQGVTYDRVGGSLTAVGALGVVVHNTSIGGNLSIIGGGGGVAGGPGSGACFAAPPPPLWAADPALAGVPVYSDSEDNTIGRNLTIAGLQSCWLGTLRNQVAGNASVLGNAMSDPDAMEVSENMVDGNMTCAGNLPAIQFGEGGTPNIVGRYGSGECGFNVILPNPAPEAMAGPSVNEHIAVKAASLGTYRGAHIQTGGQSTLFGVTESHQTLLGAQNTDVLVGSGLTGQVTEQALITVFPDGSQAFMAQDQCACTFQGRSGTVTIRAYGTTSRAGKTVGTFVVMGAAGGLATLAGDGTFFGSGSGSGSGDVVHLVEHLRIT